MTNPSVIALGFFDGVHIGHGALLRRTVQRAHELSAEPAVFTFDRPPKEVVTGNPVPLINSAQERQEIIRRLYGIDRVILAHFAVIFPGHPDFYGRNGSHARPPNGLHHIASPILP